MTDLIERLRDPNDPYPASLLTEAADEIERLKDELKQANAVVDNETINALRAENERLRAALAEIVDCINHDYSRRDIETVAHNALAALD